MRHLREYALVGIVVATIALPAAASALTADEVRAQIQALVSQVTVMQTQLKAQSAPATPAAPTQTTQKQMPAMTTNAACPQFSRALAYGTRGDDVLALQNFLYDQGLLDARYVNGGFTGATIGAVQQLQTRYNIVSAGSPETTGYGVVGPRTQRLITLNCAAHAQTPAQRPAASASQGASVCPVAPRPLLLCSGTWQAVSDVNGCTTAWECSTPLPGATSTAPTPAPSVNNCPINPRPNSACSGSWRAATNSAGCTSGWQCN